MSLAVGARLGSYEVTAQIGAGGMGEVYRATDTKLKRDVALKVLPAALASDPDRLARFQREAELLATLNHPNIAAIYGLEDAAGSSALVLELVEGETLAERIARSPLPQDDAVSVARQIVDALEAAHEKGVIHRDLKPTSKSRQRAKSRCSTSAWRRCSSTKSRRRSKFQPAASNTRGSPPMASSWCS
jgi:serine/threonine protein kinase